MCVRLVNMFFFKESFGSSYWIKGSKAMVENSPDFRFFSSSKVVITRYSILKSSDFAECRNNKLGCHYPFYNNSN